jgi:hypothetical protein
MELPNTHAHTYGIHTHTHTPKKKVERLGKKAGEKVERTNKKKRGVRKERKKKRRKDRYIHMYICKSTFCLIDLCSKLYVLKCKC